MSGSLADPELSALILWFVLPAALLAGGACLAFWWARRAWVVVEAVIRSVPDGGVGATEVAWRNEAGEVRVAQVFLPSPKGPRAVGTLVALSHPPGQPEALQPGTPGPLLAGAVAAGLVAMLCISVLLGV
ncbi:cytochrome c-type biogenesis protein CcmH [Roseomonas sp. HF4]|uniref:cytochrome c-type biogenesis protein CcmH n=1 Tax=Roseomonas sp. HF4 TaxID=2562313 RepID=UPI0010C004E5|nr:cytochrome c-type biogenesis protein CcmH [Roseomonas sp. HF4]